MYKMIFKLLKLFISMCILAWMASLFPPLGGAVTINGFVGIFLGLIYVKDSSGRYHHGWSGRYVSSEEALFMTCVLPLLGIGIPVITIFTLPMYAMEQVVTATVGAEIVGFVGGMFTT